MSVLWKNIEFYKGESDHEVMITAAGSLEGTLSHPVDSFFNCGGGGTEYGGHLSPTSQKMTNTSPIKSYFFPYQSPPHKIFIPSRS